MIALIKLSPMVFLAGLMMSGMDILIAAPIAFVAAVVVAMLTDRFAFSELQDAALDNLKHFLTRPRGGGRPAPCGAQGDPPGRMGGVERVGG